MKVTLPYPPATNNLYLTVHGRRVLSPRGREYKEQAGWTAKAAGLRPIPAGRRVSVLVLVFRPRKVGDLDNTLKVVLDALTGIAWEDDSQIAEIHAFRSDDKANPRVELSIDLLTETA